MKVGVAGLGLIGGSLALALRARHQVRGFDTDRAARDSARDAGVETVDALDALLPAEAVIVATPIDAVVPTLRALAARAGDAVLLDVASVRAPVQTYAASAPERCKIVGLHPMAGRSGSGFRAASAELFTGRPFLVVPTARSDSESMAVAGTLARDAGGHVTVVSAQQHDRIVAVLSALPLAFASALALAADELDGELGSFSGPGFADATRLALTAPELGSALLLANADNVRAALARSRELLDELERAIDARDAATVRALLARAFTARQALS